ncbi:unnamed protein product [Rotaria socialis]
MVRRPIIGSQTTVICPTAVWNSTFRILAGISGNAGASPVILNNPFRAIFGPNSTMYVADQSNNRIQKFVGGSPTGAAVTNLTLSNPCDVYVDNNNVLYILDTSNYRVLRWDNNVVTVVAGGFGAGSTYDKMSTSYSMFVDASYNIYVSDYGNNRVALWSAGFPNMSQLVAGGYGAGSTPDKLYNPMGIYVDSFRTIYIADSYNHRIQQWNANAIIGITVAGTTAVAGSWSYLLNYPTAVIYDQYNYLYILDSSNDRIQRWVPRASYGITVVASSMSNPRGLNFDSSGNMIVADMSLHMIISFGISCPPNATTTTPQTTQATVPVCATAAWNQTFSVIAGSSGNAGTSRSLLQYPHNVYIDVYGNLYVSDCNNHRIQRYPRGSMFADTVAGITSSAGSSYSQLYYPTSIYVDSNSTMYILDWTNCRILRWALGDPLGSVVAGGNGCGGALTQMDNSYGLFVDNQSNVYISEYRNHRVVKWLASNTTSGILLAGGYGAGSTADKLNYPWGVYVDGNQGVYVVDHSNHRVQFWAYGSLLGVTVAGMTGNSGSWSYQFTNPTAITFDPYGYMYVLDTGNSRVQKWFPGAAYGQTVAAAASMSTAYGLQIDHSGNIIVCDTYSHRVISFGITCPASTTTTTAQPTTPITQLCSTATWNTTLTLQAGLSGTGGTSTILLNYPANMYFDGYQNLYVVDRANHRIQLFAPGSFIGSTVAGNSGAAGSGYSELSSPYAIYVDGNRTMYILDTSNYRILKWRLGEPLGYVIVGNQAAGSSLNQISTSYGMFVDNQYNIYVSDSGNNRVAKWLATNTTAGIVVAGGNGAGSAPEKLNNPWGVYVNANQAVYVVDRNNHRVQLWANGVTSGITVAGTTGISGPWSYQLNSPTSVMLDPTGFMYILDSGNARILKWWPGALYGTTILTGSFSTPLGMQLDRANNLVVADTNNHRIVSFGLLCLSATTTTAPPPSSATSQICTTAVWNQVFSTLAGSSGNRGSSTTLLYNPSDMKFDSYQNLYVVDTANHRIQKFNSGSSVGTTAIGTGSAGSSYSELNSPSAIYIDANRTMFILDTSNYRVLKWKVGDPLGTIVAGSQTAGSGLNQITTSYAMFVDNQYNVYVSEYGNHRVTMWLATNTTAGILVAGGNGAGSTSDKLNYPWGVYVDVNGTIYVVDRNNHRVQRWNSGAMTGTTVGGSNADPGPYAYQFSSPTAITFDRFGYMYILDSGNSRVQRWLPGATYGITIAATSMSTPYGMEIGPLGNIVIADTFNYRILSFALTCPSVTTTTAAPPFQATVPVCATAIWNQTFSTLVGSMGTAGSSPTLLYNPSSIAFDGYRNMYITDISNHRIQLYAPGSNIGTTIAGITSSSGSSRSQLNSPYGLHVTSNGTMFILDTSNYRVLQWQTGDPMGYVMAGGNGNGAALTQIGVSYALFVDDQYNIYISESSNNRITKWSRSNSTSGALVAGGNGAGNTGDKLSNPWGIYVTNQSTYIADRSNHRIQKWDFGASLATTVAGSTSNPGSWSYQFNNPVAITFDPSGYMYILDAANDRIVQWYPSAPYGITVVSAIMSTPLSMEFDPLGNIIISDTSYNRVISFSIMCPSTTTTTTPLPTQTTIPVCQTAFWNQTYSILAGSMGTTGTTSTLLYNPYDVQFDGYGNMYVVDCSNHRIQRFPSGSNAGITIAGSSGSAGSSLSQLYNPSKIFVSSNQTMYILDTTNYRVLTWIVGDLLGYVVAGGNGNGGAFTQIGVSYGMFVTDSHNIYISEQSNHRVMKWLNGNTTAGVLVAGGNGAGSTADKLNSPWGVYVNVNGTIFVVDRGNHRVQMWNPGASVGSTVAGSTSNPGSWSYQFNSPTSITFDPYGYMYVVDYNNARIQRWYPGASYGTTVASGTMNLPNGLTFDRLGNLVVADTSNQRIISYSLVCPVTTTTTIAPPIPTTTPLCSTSVWNQTISIIAGSTSNTGSTSTSLYNPYDIDFDGYNNLYVVDCYNHRVQRFQPGSLTGSTVAGVTGSSGSSQSQLYYPTSISVTKNETMFIMDTSNYRVLKWAVGDPLGYVVAGGNGNGGAFTQIGASYALFIDAQYNIYISDNSNNRITKWLNGNTTAGALIAGGNGAGSTPDKLNAPWGIYVDNTSGIYIVDRGNHRVQYWSYGASFGSTVAGTTGVAGPWSYQFNSPTSITLDSYGYLYIMDFNNQRVQKWLPGANFGVTVATTTMSNPYGMTMDPFGNIVVADSSYQRIISFGLMCPASTTTTHAPSTQAIVPLCVTAIWNQTSSTLAGSISAAGSTSTLLSSPYDMDFDEYGNMYVVDFNNHRIQKYPLGISTGTTVAGFSIGGGSSRSELYYPSAIVVKPNGTMFILDRSNFRVLKWQTGDTLGYVVAGGNGNGGAFTQISTSYGIYVDDSYNVYISDQSNHRVTKWTNGNATTSALVAGGNGAGSTADKLNSPWGVYVNVNGTIFVVDRGNHRVQMWNPGASVGSTVAGSTSNPGSWSYQFNSPTSITFDPYGYMYVVDYNNARIQRWYPGASYGTTVASGTMNLPNGLTFDRLGNLVVADTSNQRIISYSLVCPASTTTTISPTPQNRIPLCSTAIWNATATTVVGAISNAGSTSTLLSSPYDVQFDGYGYMYVVDCNNHRIQRFPSGSNVGTTVAGFNLASGSGLSELYNPSAIFVDSTGAMYILDTNNYRVLKWQLGDQIGTIIVNGRGSGSTLDKIGRSNGFFVDTNYNIYVSEFGNNRITKWINGNNTAGSLVAGGNGAGSTPDKLNAPWGIYVDNTSGIYIVDQGNHRVQYWPSGASVATTVAGATGNPGPWSYQFNTPSAIMRDPYGFIYILDTGNARVQKWYPGNPYGTTIISATMNSPLGMSLDLSGNLFIADTSYYRIISFRVTCLASTTTAAPQPTQPIIQLCATAVWNQTYSLATGSTSTIGSSGTLLYNPYDVAFDGYQNMYVVDTSNQRIQFFQSGLLKNFASLIVKYVVMIIIYISGSSTGITVAGSTGSAGSTMSQLYNPFAIYVDTNGTMYILDAYNYRVLRWQLGDPIGFVVAGGHGSGTTLGTIGLSYGLFLDNQYNIYISDTGNNRVVKWVAGNTTAGLLVAGGNGAGSTADKLNGPFGIYIDSTNAVFVVDRNNHRVQCWTSGSISGTTVAGTTGSAGPWPYQFSSPTSIAFDQYGYMYILDQGNSRVQKWFPGATYGTTVISASMSSPYGMRIDRLGNFFIADTSYQRILSFSLLCPPATTSPAPSTTVMPIPLCQTATWNSTYVQVAGATSVAGSTQYLLSSPYGVAVDVYQNTYVVDYNNHRIQRFQLGSIAASTVAGVSNVAGTGFSQLYYPTAIHVDSNGLMYILDSYNYRVLLWQVGYPLGTVIVGGRGSGTTFDKIALSYGLYVDIQYNVYVSESGNNRVTKWFYGNTTAGILVAGGSVAGNTADKLNAPWGVYVDSGNSLYVVDSGNHRVQRWAMGKCFDVMTSFNELRVFNEGAAAGVTIAGSTSNPGPWSYQFNNPTTITMDPFGYIFVLDSGNSRVQKWYPGGSFGITVLSATLNGAIGMQVDPTGKLFVTDTGNHRILAFPVSCPSTTTTTLAPPTLTTTLMCLTAVWSSNATLITGSIGFAGSTPTFVSSPYGVSFDGYGYMYVADTGNHRIQKYSPGSNIGNTVAGVTGSAGSSLSQLNSPSAIQFDSTGQMYILDTSNYRVLKWALGDLIGTVVVNGRGSGTSLTTIGVSYSICLDSQSNIYVSEYGNQRVTKWIAGNNTIGQMVAGTSVLGSTADKLNYPMGIYVDINNAVYVTDRSNHRIQKWPSGAALGTTVAGQSAVSGTWSYQLNLPTAITFDQYGYMYVMDAGNSRIQRWLPGMTYGVTVVAATVSTPYGINFDFAGNIIVADTSNQRIIAFRITCPNPTTVTAPFPTLPPNLACQTGVFNTSWSIVAGTSPTAGSSSVYLNNPMDVYVDGNQNIFVADYSNSRIQRFPPAGTSIGAPMGTTVAGFTQAGGSGYSELSNPTAIFIDLNETMYIADYSNYRIQKWLPNQPVGFTVAGGHGNGATLDKIGAVYAIFIDAGGNIYVSDNSNNRVTLWYASNTTAGQLVAGTGTAGTALNQLNGPWGAVTGILIAGTTASSGSTAALLNLPTAITLDTSNYLYVMDAGNNRIQRFAPGASLGDTMASMAFNNPRGMRIDSVGNLFIADMSNNRIISFRCVYNVSTTTITTSTTTSDTTTSSTSTSTTSTTSTTGISTTTTTTTAMVTILTTSLTTSVTVLTAITTTVTTLTGSTTTVFGATTTTVFGATTTTVFGATTTTVFGATTTIAFGATTTTAFGATTTAGVITTATGVTTTAMGVTTTAMGVTTTAMGVTTTAMGVTTTAMGVTTTAMGVTTTAMGVTTTAMGVTTTAMGVTTITTGSVGNTVGQAASNTDSGSSQSSSNISMIAAGVAGGIVALAAGFGGIAFIVTKMLLKPSSGVSTNIATSQKTFPTKSPQHPTKPATNSNSSSKTTCDPNNSSKTGNSFNSTSNNETGPQLTTQLNIAPKIYNVTRIT